MISTLQRLPGNTIEITFTLDWKNVKESFDTLLKAAAAEVELPGFRKGKAPFDLAVKQIDRTKVYEKVIEKLVPAAYGEAIEEHKISPIVSPKIELIEAEEEKDWKLKATTCEKPKIVLKKYKDAIAKLKTGKVNKIWVPGKDQKEEKKDVEPTIGEVLDAVYTEIEVDLSPLLIEQEANRLLSNLVSETQKVGISVDQYLQAQGKTQKQIREEYEAASKKTLSLEFALEEISEAEKITVADAEIDKVIAEAKTEENRKQLTQRRYYLASLLRRQKTLDNLLKTTIVKV